MKKGKHFGSKTDLLPFSLYLLSYVNILIRKLIVRTALERALRIGKHFILVKRHLARVIRIILIKSKVYTAFAVGYGTARLVNILPIHYFFLQAFF